MRRIKYLLLACCLMALCLAACSAEPGGANVVQTPEPTPAVTSITAVMSAEELSQLEQYPELKYLDLSGSTCYAEILDYMVSHPEVEVKYTVDTGTEVLPQDAESANVTADTDSTVFLNAIIALPELKTISFDAVEPELDMLEGIVALFPDIEMSYEVDVLGKKYASDTTTLDLSKINAAQCEAAAQSIKKLLKLTYVDLGAQSDGRLSFADVGILQSARNDVTFDYRFVLFEKEFSTSMQTFDLNHIKMQDKGAAVREVLPYMTKCTYLDMDSCGVSHEDMASIRDDFPNMKVVWRVNFGPAYSVRTDVERILASIKGEYLTAESVKVLKYCTDVKYLDLGHNIIGDISFVEYMPDLEVAVLAINYWSDATPLASCKKLEYLEIFNTNCHDISPLAELENLKHLNICWLKELSDITPLYEMTSLERLWIGCTNKVPQEQKDEIVKRLPNCVINTTTDSPTFEGWREGPRYELLVQQFDYENYKAVSFYYHDEKYYPNNGD